MIGIKQKNERPDCYKKILPNIKKGEEGGKAMKKILVIKNEKKLIKTVGDYFIAFMPNLFGDVVPKAYVELQGLIVKEFFKHELKDVEPDYKQKWDELKVKIKEIYGNTQTTEALHVLEGVQNAMIKLEKGDERPEKERSL